MQHDRAALIVAHDVERVLTDIDADYGDCGIEFLRHGVLLVFGAPGQLKTLAGQEHGRTIPLPDHRRGDDITGRYSIREKSPAEAGQKFREECSLTGASARYVSRDDGKHKLHINFDQRFLADIPQMNSGTAWKIGRMLRPRPRRSKPTSILESSFVPTDGTRLPIVRSGDFGRSPFFEHLSAKQFAGRAKTLR